MPSKRSQALLAVMKALRPLTGQMAIQANRQAQDNLVLLLHPSKKATFEEFDIDGVLSLWCTPKQSAASRKVILYCHGGAYVAGSIQYARILASKICELSGLPVLAFEYRLAPEHPYPAQLDDALTVWSYLLQKGYAPQDIILVGESAGGNLALAMCHQLHMLGSSFPCGLLCLSPWTDLTGSGSSYTAVQEDDATLNGEFLHQAAAMYADGEKLTDPLLSPLFGDFRGFPPTLIQAGTHEILMDDSTRLHHNLQAAGVDSTLELYDGMCHVFQLYPFPEAKAAIRSIQRFLHTLTQSGPVR
jgi:monoterpene epsilon-lactone hydrolase